jgi:thimet oligopeptidase
VKDAQVWSPDVKLYQINDNKDNRLIGYFYTDFVPRPYKYGHAAAFPQISGRVLPNGSYSLPVAAIVANLAAPANGKPSLLSHDDVETVFHEFGHIMHMTLTRAPYASLSGSNVAQDFVEAPSQMLENWVWDADVLNRLSGHYLDHSQKLPADLLQKMIAARDFDQGYYYTRQLMLALTDMDYHTADGAVDTAAVYNRNYQEMIGVKPVEGGHFAGTFGHLMGGYDAGYYGYLWSLVYATDMFTRFQDGGLLSPQVGGDYRRVILEKGNSKDAIDLLGEFLGRAPNSEAFYKKLHIYCRWGGDA